MKSHLIKLYLKALREGELDNKGLLGISGAANLALCIDIIRTEESLKVEHLDRRKNKIFIEAVSISKSRLYKVLA